MDDLHGQVIDSSRKGFSRAMEVSCHSFAELAQLCVPHMAAGGSLLSMTYLGAVRRAPPALRVRRPPRHCSPPDPRPAARSAARQSGAPCR
jgi:hypothetical protein